MLSGYSYSDSSGLTPASCIAECAQRNFALGKFEGERTLCEGLIVLQSGG